METGIAEQNLVSIAAGLAKCGKKSYAVSPACFLSTRSYEQCKVDVAYSNTNVKLIGISGGVSYGALGMSHHSAQDIAALPGDIADRLGPLGITGARAKIILGLAQKVVSGELDFTLCARPEAEIKKLLAIPGIGPWTAQYIAMRGLGWPDAFPHTDLGVKKALAPLSEAEILETAEDWRPWRGYAVINLWNSPARPDV